MMIKHDDMLSFLYN